MTASKIFQVTFDCISLLCNEKQIRSSLSVIAEQSLEMEWSLHSHRNGRSSSEAQVITIRENLVLHDVGPMSRSVCWNMFPGENVDIFEEERQSHTPFVSLIPMFWKSFAKGFFGITGRHWSVLAYCYEAISNYDRMQYQLYHRMTYWVCNFVISDSKLRMFLTLTN